MALPLNAIVTDGAVGYGSGAPGRKFFEDIAATPDSPSPSKWPGAEPGTQSSSSFGSANQKTMWFRSVRTPVMLLNANASSMMASTRTDPLPRRIRGEVPDILNRAEGRHRHFGQEDRKRRIGPQTLGMQIQRIHTANVLPRKNGDGCRRVRQAGCDGT